MRKKNQFFFIDLSFDVFFFFSLLTYLCWRKPSGRLKCLPQTSHENETSGLLWTRSWIIKLYGLLNVRWQYLHVYSHFGRILRRKSDRRSSLSILIIANIFSFYLFFCFYLGICSWNWQSLLRIGTRWITWLVLLGNLRQSEK